MLDGRAKAFFDKNNKCVQLLASWMVGFDALKCLPTHRLHERLCIIYESVFLCSVQCCRIIIYWSAHTDIQIIVCCSYVKSDCLGLKNMCIYNLHIKVVQNVLEIFQNRWIDDLDKISATSEKNIEKLVGCYNIMHKQLITYEL